MSPVEFSQLRVVDHPLVAHHLTILRDRRTSQHRFRASSRILSRLLVAEAVADLPLRPVEIATPLEEGVEGAQVSKPPVLAAVLRAGVGMLDGALDLLEDSPIGYIGLQRDEETVQPVTYYAKLPPTEGARVLVLEPMLATGGSLSRAVDMVKAEGAEDVVTVCMVTCPEGVANFADRHPDTPIVTAGHDRGLDSRSYILPGLGDMGDRLFGTPH